MFPCMKELKKISFSFSSIHFVEKFWHICVLTSDLVKSKIGKYWTVNYVNAANNPFREVVHIGWSNWTNCMLYHNTIHH